MTGQTVTAEYLAGIREGRDYLNRFGPDIAMQRDILANIRETLKGFGGRDNPVGQLLKGERDFWINQIKKWESA